MVCQRSHSKASLNNVYFYVLSTCLLTQYKIKSICLPVISIIISVHCLTTFRPFSFFEFYRKSKGSDSASVYLLLWINNVEIQLGAKFSLRNVYHRSLRVISSGAIRVQGSRRGVRSRGVIMPAL